MGGQFVSMDEWSDLLFHSPYRNNIKSVFVQGVVLGIAQSTIFYLFAAGYSFGAFLVILNRATYDQIFR